MFRLKHDWIRFETWRREGATVDVKSWILLFPLCSTVLEPDFHLKFKIEKDFVANANSHLSLSQVEGKSKIESFANREIARRLELVL